MKAPRNIKRAFLIVLASAVAAVGLLVSAPLASAQMGGGISSASLWKLAGSTVSLVNSAWTVALGTVSVSGVVSGDMTVVGDIYSAGLEWTARTSSTDNEWRSITYGNGLFVASSKTGSGNQIMTSPDGINWTTRSTPTAREWRYVTYGNGMFVAVAATGTGNRIMTSPDGVNWTPRTSPADYLWRAVAWGGGQFVATANNGTGNQVMTSPDGINWTLRSTPATGQWANVRYGNGIWVTASADGLSTTNQVMTSPDGINWTAHDSSVVCDFFGLEYGKGLFIASGTDCLMTSPDGVTWTTRTVPSGSSHQWHAIKYGDGLFVSVSKTGTERAMYSYDGITWTVSSTPNTNAYHDVTFGNGMFVAAANSGTGNRIMTSGNMRSYDVTNDGVTRRAVTISATGTETLAVQGGDGNNFFTADTANRLLSVIGAASPTSNLLQVQNKNDSARYFTISSTSAQVVDGTVTAPSYSFLSDPGTGMYRLSASNIAFTGGGAIIGRFGAGGVGASALYGISDTDTSLSFLGSNALRFLNGGAESMRIDASGNVGIGATAYDARLTVADELSSPTANIFQIQNANDSSRYMTVSSTSTALNGCTGSVSANAVTCSGTIGTITDSTDVNLSSSRAAITLTNTAIQTTSVITASVCSTPDAGAGFTVAVTPGAGTATVSVRNVGLSNQTSDYKFCFHVFNPL